MPSFKTYLLIQVGVRFDEPVGKSDGYVKGTKIFDCAPRYGGFIRGANLKVGEYPERDLMDEDEAEVDGGQGKTSDGKEGDEGDDEM